MINDTLATASKNGRVFHEVVKTKTSTPTSAHAALEALIETYDPFTYDRTWLERYLGKR